MAPYRLICTSRSYEITGIRGQIVGECDSYNDARRIVDTLNATATFRRVEALPALVELCSEIVETENLDARREELQEILSEVRGTEQRTPRAVFLSYREAYA